MPRNRQRPDVQVRINDNFGKTVKKYRRDHKITQEQIGDHIALERAAVAMLERGDVYWKLCEAVEVARFFGVSLESLAGLEPAVSIKDLETLQGIREVRTSLNSLEKGLLGLKDET